MNPEIMLKNWAPILVAGESKITKMETKKALAQILENTAEEFEKHGLLSAATGMTQAQALGQSPYEKGNSKGVLKGKLGREKGAGDTGADFYLPNVIMPMLRRIFPSLIAHERVGVQALNGPVGYALAYRAKYGTTGGLGLTGDGGYGKDEKGNPAEIGFNPVDTRYSGI